MRYLLLLLLFVACSQNPKTDLKSPLNRLNGENYNASPATATLGAGSPNIPLFGPRVRPDRLTTISGTVLTKSGLLLSPLNNQKLTLYSSEGKKLTEFKSEAGGKFKIAGEFPNGSYRIRHEGKKFQGQLDFEIKSYEINDLKIFLQEI